MVRIFKHFFDDKEAFQELADYYDKDSYHLLLKTIAWKNKAIKLWESHGFDMDLFENLKGE